MTRCNGFCSVGRAIPAKRTRAGRAAPSAGREAPCFAAPALRRWKGPQPWLGRGGEAYRASSTEGGPWFPPQEPAEAPLKEEAPALRGHRGFEAWV